MGGTGGSAVHTLTEEIDKSGRVWSTAEIAEAWTIHFDEAVAENEKSGFSLAEFYVGGRASARWPNKENVDWWNDMGPRFVASWVTWLAEAGWEIAEVPDIETGELVPAIETAVTYRTGTGLEVKSIIDRVVRNKTTGDHAVVDIKTGSMTPAWPMQMAYNGYGLYQCYDILPRWSGYWKARKGAVDIWYDMDDMLGMEFLNNQAEVADRIKKSELFMAVPSNLCHSACGVKAHCPVYKSPLTPNTDESE